MSSCLRQSPRTCESSSSSGQTRPQHSNQREANCPEEPNKPLTPRATRLRLGIAPASGRQPYHGGSPCPKLSMRHQVQAASNAKTSYPEKDTSKPRPGDSLLKKAVCGFTDRSRQWTIRLRCQISGAKNRLGKSGCASQRVKAQATRPPVRRTRKRARLILQEDHDRCLRCRDCRRWCRRS